MLWICDNRSAELGATGLFSGPASPDDTLIYLFNTILISLSHQHPVFSNGLFPSEILSKTLFSFIAYIMSGNNLERIVLLYFITPELFYAKIMGGTFLCILQLYVSWLTERLG